MATHEVYVEFTIQMQEMDGSPEDSAEVFLDVYVDNVRKAIEDVTGHAVSHFEVTGGYTAYTDENEEEI